MFGFGETEEERNRATAKDEFRLRQLGYRQELKRELTTFTNIGVALSVICVCSGLTALFGTGLTSGGPAVLVYSWIVVAATTMLVGLSMAEICSAFPTSGGLYYYAARLTSPEWMPFASWMTGYLNLMGQFGVTAGIAFGLALMVAATVSTATDFTWSPTPGATVGIHIAICLTIGIANSLGTKVMSRLMWVSTWWQVIAPFVLVITILAKAPTHQSASYVFTHYENRTGIESEAWVIFVGLLVAQYTFTGYDSSAHVTEETRKAEIAGPIGIVMAIGLSFITGLLFILGFLFSMQDYDATISTVTNLPITQIMFDATDKTTTIILMIVNMLACWFCALASLVANSRMIYAFSRDGALPASNFWHTIHPTIESPVNANWLAVFVSAILALPYLGNSTAYTAVTSIATIGLYLSYGVPVLCKLLNPKLFRPGPFNLGRYSGVINGAALAWIALITVLFVLPTVNPLTPSNMNYACVAVGAVVLGASGAWVVSARKWFKGPKINLSEKEKQATILDFEDETGSASNWANNDEPPISAEKKEAAHHDNIDHIEEGKVNEFAD